MTSVSLDRLALPWKRSRPLSILIVEPPNHFLSASTDQALDLRDQSIMHMTGRDPHGINPDIFAKLAIAGLAIAFPHYQYAALAQSAA